MEISVKNRIFHTQEWEIIMKIFFYALREYDEKKYEGEFLELMRIGYEEMSDINLELSRAIDFSKGNVQYKFDDICEYEKWLCGV